MILITTERLEIREFTSDDTAFIFKLVNSPNWLKYIGDRGVKTTYDALLYISDKIIDSYVINGYGLYCIQLKDTSEPIGMCGLVKREGLEQPDLGFAILPEYEKNGYAFEATEGILQYSKNELKITNIVAITTAENLSSISLLQKLGFSFKNKMWLPNLDKDMMLFGFY